MGAHLFFGEAMKLKEATTFEEQIELLEQKNILIDNREQCLNLLKRINYYRLSAYYLPYKGPDGKCIYNIPFSQIAEIYEFDKELRKLILSTVEQIEIFLRTQMAYYHVHKYGPDGYMSPKVYNKKHNHALFSKHVTSCINENSKTLIVQHHMQKYNGKFPLWVIIEFFSIGMLSHFYRGMSNPDKAALAKSLYGVNYQTMDSWLRCLTDLRNRCAHYSRLYYVKFPAIPKMPKGENYTPTRRLFAQFYMLKLMYPEKDKWNDDVLKQLDKLMKKYKPYISKNHLDFPYRWKSLLTIK